MVAFKEIDSRAERSANAVYSLASSETNCLPLLPCGTLKKFLLQCTTISYESFNSSENDSESLVPQAKCGSATGIGINTGTCTVAGTSAVLGLGIGLVSVSVGRLQVEQAALSGA